MDKPNINEGGGPPTTEAKGALCEYCKGFFPYPELIVINPGVLACTTCRREH